MKQGKPYLWLVLAFVWVGAVFLLSTRTGIDSHEMSNSFAELIGSVFIPDFSSWAPTVQRDWLAGMDHLIRKVAHFLEFGMLGIFVFSFLFSFAKSRKKKNINKGRYGMYAFYCCLLVCGVDEMIQLTSIGRTSSPTDVLLDCAGAVFGILLAAYKAKMPKAPDVTSFVGHRNP